MGLSLKTILLGVTLVMSPLFFISPTYAANPVKSNIVDEFCNQRKTTRDRAFCTRVLKSFPSSASAKDYSDLLKIAIKLAVANAKRTRNFIKTKTKCNGIKPAAKDALEDCILAYNGSIKQLAVVFEDLDDDPPMVSYDTHVARKELSNCQETLVKSKIVYGSLIARHQIAIQYARLYEDIARSI